MPGPRPRITSAAIDGSGTTDLSGENRYVRRSRRKRKVRALTTAIKSITLRERLKSAAAEPDDGRRRLPMTRGECKDGARPCPLVSCKHHLYLDVNPRTGSFKLTFPDLEVENMAHSCALDVAEQGGVALEDVGIVMNLTRERVRQLEVKALQKLEAYCKAHGLDRDDLVHDVPLRGIEHGGSSDDE